MQMWVFQRTCVSSAEADWHASVTGRQMDYRQTGNKRVTPLCPLAYTGDTNICHDENSQSHINIFSLYFCSISLHLIWCLFTSAALWRKGHVTLTAKVFRAFPRASIVSMSRWLVGSSRMKKFGLKYNVVLQKLCCVHSKKILFQQQWLWVRSKIHWKHFRSSGHPSQ